VIRKSSVRVPCGRYLTKHQKHISGSIRARVQAAREVQNERFSCNGSSSILCNADKRVGEIRQFCKFLDEGQSLMQAATCTAQHRAVHETAQFVRAGLRMQSMKLTMTTEYLISLAEPTEAILQSTGTLSHTTTKRPKW
jgi:predicted ATPase with chaperone activity